MPERVAIASDDSRRNIGWLGGWVNNNVRKTIKGKYLMYLVTGVLASSLLVGFSNTAMMYRKVVSDATATMNMHCREIAGNVEDRLPYIEEKDEKSLEDVANKVSREKLYDSESTFIIGDGIIVRSKGASGDDGTSATDELIVFKDMLTGKSNGDELKKYHFNAVDKRMVYTVMDNGMKVVITADQNEIFDEIDLLVILNILIASGVGILLVGIGYRFVLELTKPLEELSDAAEILGTGNLRVEIPGTDQEDEVGNLARSFQSTVNHLQKYVDYIQTLAYKDGLTDMQNKAAYDKSMEQLDVKARLKTAEFAIVMIDLNFLKRINDTYGHEIGNRYILTLCAKIASIFPIEEIYRIGGDEFVVILKEGYYERRDELVQRFKDSMEADKTDPKRPWERVSAAVGMAAYDPRTDAGTDEVFKRADAAMYENKLAMKAERRD